LDKREGSPATGAGLPNGLDRLLALGITAAPPVAILVAEPDAAILLPALHLDIVDRAPAAVIASIGGAIGIVAIPILGDAGNRLAIDAVAVDHSRAAGAQQKRKSVYWNWETSSTSFVPKTALFNSD
jgi:hypothetical protein